MIYNTLSALYARFVCHAVRAPPEYPQFDFDGTNKLRPDVSGFTSAIDALVWAVDLANEYGAACLRLKSNCVMMRAHMETTTN